MNKLFTRISMALVGIAMAVGVGVAIGGNAETRMAEATAAYTFQTPKNDSNTNYNENYDVAISGVTWRVPGNQSTANQLKLGGGKNASIGDRVIYSKGAISGKIGSVKMTFGSESGSITVNSISMGVYGTADNAASGSSPIESKTFTYAASGNSSVSPSSGTWDDKFYRFEFDLSEASIGSNVYITLVSIEFDTGSGGGGGVDPTPSQNDQLIITADYISLDTTGFTNKTNQSYTGSDSIVYKLGSGGSNTVKGTEIKSSSTNAFNTSENPILMGKNGAYIYNSTEFEYEIVKFELYSNFGASTSVVVGAEFGVSEMTSAIASSSTHKKTLSTANSSYNYTYADMSAGYTYFRVQVMSAHNAQLQIRITFKTPHYEASAFEQSFIYKNIAYPASTPTGVAGTACLSTSKGGLGYYDSAMEAYDLLSNEAKVEFGKGDEFANARERLIAWAKANGVTISFDGETGELIQSAKVFTPIAILNNSSTTLVIIVISAISLIAVSSFFVIRRRKENN